MKAALRRAWVWLPALGWAGTIWFVSSRRVDAVHLPGPSDKVIHFFVFAFLALLLGRALRYEWSAERMTRAAVVAALIAAVYGGVDEIHQSFVPGRFCQGSDFIADLLGACVAAWAFRRHTSRAVARD
ncbi:MAG: VanZ family protein [Deltaproteobacteria bacterium]|nr:VanZ family protein [Deltaproteobacteria bacterium]